MTYFFNIIVLNIDELQRVNARRLTLYRDKKSTEKSKETEQHENELSLSSPTRVCYRVGDRVVSWVFTAINGLPKDRHLLPSYGTVKMTNNDNESCRKVSSVYSSRCHTSIGTYSCYKF